MKVGSSRAPLQLTDVTSKKCVSVELCSSICVAVDAVERDYRPLG